MKTEGAIRTDTATAVAKDLILISIALSAPIAIRDILHGCIASLALCLSLASATASQCAGFACAVLKEETITGFAYAAFAVIEILFFCDIALSASSMVGNIVTVCITN